MTQDTKKREQEQAYILPSEIVEDFAGSILDASQIGEFTFGETEHHVIVDQYYDTPDNDLRMSTVSLRVRNLDGKLLITFKGKEKDDQFTQNHDEWEFPWKWDLIDPADFAASAGLELVQTRNTNRITRYLFDEDEKVAELNIDASLYTVSTGEAKIFELEIERLGKRKLKSIRKELEKEIPLLEPLRWPHGKFVTGKAIEFAFGVKTGADNVLETSSLTYLEAMFKQLKVFK